MFIARYELGLQTKQSALCLKRVKVVKLNYWRGQINLSNVLLRAYVRKFHG